MDRNNFAKKATIYIAIFFAVLLLIGMIFFRKDDDNVEENNLKLDDQQLIEDVKDEEITKKKRVRVFAENFTMTHYSYTWGNFSNIESQYYYMTDEMKDREENKIEKMKSKIKNQARKYFTVRAEVISLELIDYQENKKATLDIKLKIKEVDGAFVINTEVPEIRPDTSALIDGNKNVYTGDIEDLVIKTTDKSVNTKLVKIGNEWKIDEIEEVEK